MQNILEKIDGKKTYIGGVILFIVGGLNALCKLPVLNVCVEGDLYNTLTAVGVAVGLFGLRHAITKVFENQK